MNAALKQRVVGAIVLVALAVIFVPMLLDGAGTRDDVAREVGIPDRPTFADPELDDVPEPVTPEDDPPPDAPDAVAEPETEAAGEWEPEPSDEDDRDEGDREGDDGEADEDVAATSDDTDADAPSAWAVQTGSFSRRDNAVTQRDRLQDAGFDAFIDAGDTDSGRVWRVRVGPLGLETEARSLRDRLENDEDLEGLVVSHP